MAIKFETVTGNQTSANVLAQINNNFAKINSSPVPKADFATNADTVDNKHASELIPGAATFLDSITSLANLSIGRYFCTQTRQSWEPVITTGSRTFLIEVSLNTPNSLKNYKINYIAGVGAGESYYSDYSNGSIRWNRIINNNNVASIDAVKNTYDEDDNKGRITTYNDMIVYKEGKSLVKDDFIQVNDGTGNYYRTSASFIFSQTSIIGSVTYYHYNLKVTIQIYDSNFNLLKTVTGTNEVKDSHKPVGDGRGYIKRQYINIATGDMIIGAYGRVDEDYYLYNQGYFYFSAATNTCFFIPISDKIITWPDTMLPISYWYNNHFGFLHRAADHTSDSYYYNIKMTYIDLTEDRGSVVNNSYTILISNATFDLDIMAQKEQYLYMVASTRSVTTNPSLYKIDVASHATQIATIPIASTGLYEACCTDLIIDDDFIYFIIKYYSSSDKYKLFKYNLSLTLSTSSSEITDPYDKIISTDNYVAIFSSGIKCYAKSDLKLISSYNENIYSSNPHYNESIPILNSGYVTWFNQDKYNYNKRAIPFFGDYILLTSKDYFYSLLGNFEVSKIINISNGTSLGYFANAVNYGKIEDTYPIYIEGIGITFRKKILDTSKTEYLLKNFRKI